MSDDELKKMLKELTMTGFNAGYTFAIEALKHGSKVRPENECFLAAIEFSMKPVKRVRKDTSMD